MNVLVFINCNVFSYLYTNTTYRKVESCMTKKVQANKGTYREQANFEHELKMFINQKLFDKHIISEDMYWTAKELLLKQI